ncbi:MAG: hypothetical protein IPK72_22685 [Candidatus Eisenbacteria bacterium]|nr:hypothetical protein [Candidatus Eisenbacteria bacterium]
MRTIIISLLSLFVGSCDGAGDTSDFWQDPGASCSQDNPGIATTVTVHDQGGPVSANVRISGSASHGDGYVIRNLFVLGLKAENKGFNFDSWEVTVPYEVLLSRAEVADGSCSDERPGLCVPIEIEAADPCPGSPHPVTISDAVDLRIEPKVKNLALSLDYASGDYAPPGDMAKASLRVKGDDGAAYASVDLSANGVVFPGGGPGAFKVRLDKAAEANLFVSSERLGESVILARSGDASASINLRIGGRPILVPSQVSLGQSSSAYVSGLVEGGIPAPVLCRSAAVSGVSVTAVQGSLTDPSGVIFPAGSLISFVIKVDDTAQPTIFQVSCEDDRYRQQSAPLVVTIQ